MSAEKWSAVAGVGSAVAAAFALIITLQERHTPYKTALYSARWNAIEAYARASANLSTALNLVAIQVPDEVGDPATLAKMSDDQMLAAAKVARPAITAWGDYIAESSAAGAPWSVKTHDAIDKAEADGRRAYECYRWIGAHIRGDPLPPWWLDYVRKMAAQPCQGFKNNNKSSEADFDKSARDVLRAMTDELREDNDQFVPGGMHNSFD